MYDTLPVHPLHTIQYRMYIVSLYVCVCVCGGGGGGEVGERREEERERKREKREKRERETDRHKPSRPCSELQLHFCRRISATCPCHHRTVESTQMAELDGHQMGS